MRKSTTIQDGGGGSREQRAGSREDEINWATRDESRSVHRCPLRCQYFLLLRHVLFDEVTQVAIQNNALRWQYYQHLTEFIHHIPFSKLHFAASRETPSPPDIQKYVRQKEQASSVAKTWKIACADGTCEKKKKKKHRRNYMKILTKSHYILIRYHSHISSRRMNFQKGKKRRKKNGG